ncbi:MAG TPA: LON peptidase substrate-binding domain-containing protein [Burkholderiales bacterium]|nr:LON peptidase substrate-binding domain-containing protein [Burkholderiales bacterium]
MPEEHFIFPLGSVLFPGSVLPLRIFEQRYIEMTKVCIRDNRPFGVCLIKEGHEVGAPAVPHAVGCLATIEQWDMPQLGLFELRARGTERFRLLHTQAAANGLITGTVERIPADLSTAPVDQACREVLKLIIDRVGAANFPQPLELDDASWISYRLAEILPLEAQVRQSLLEVTDAGMRLDRLREILLQLGLIANEPS